MSKAEILVLGAVAGFTIFLGLPLGRWRNPNVRTKAALSALATGILIFLFFEILAHAWSPTEDAFEEAVDGDIGWSEFLRFAPLFVGGVLAGVMSLAYYDRWIAERRSSKLVGPGAAAVAEFEKRTWLDRLTPGQSLALLIAVGIGVHNFAEGLAIGQSAAADEISLALLLIIGFGLHNATEGFGIVGPMSREAERPSWGLLFLLGVIGGGPTFLGTLVGQAWVSQYLEVAFLSVAAGSLLYVIIELAHVNRSFAMKTLTTWWLLGGLFLGFATELVLEAGKALS
jgi:zinc transporter, ZIP family